MMHGAGFNGFARHGQHMMGHGLGQGWMFFHMGFRVVILVVLIVIAYKLFKKYNNKTNDSIKILNERFAKGEINEEEYLKRKTILSQKN